jgi:glycosyltransferase involved in cell wall biosynthesis
MTFTPRTSVIIPAYNAARFIGPTVESALRQTSTDHEIIVVDDGSTDGTHAALEPYLDQITYLAQDNAGRSAARNAGARLARGTYLAFLDSDDLFLPDKLTLQVPLLEADPRLGLVASGHELIDQQGDLIRQERPWLHQLSPDLQSIAKAGLAVIHAVLLRRTWFERVGGFDASLSAAEDMDLWLRLAVAGCHMTWAPAIVCQYRIHAANTSRDVRAHYQALYGVLDRLFRDPALPALLREERAEILALARLAESGRLYAVGNVDHAKARLEEALDLDPGLLANGAHRLVEAMASWEWEQSIWNSQPPGVLERAFRNLPTERLPDDLEARVARMSAKASFYRAFQSGDTNHVRRSWATVARSEPAWLLNRGSWSILLQSFGVLARVRTTP